MLRWDGLGETRVSFDSGSGGGFDAACAALEACTVPLVVHDFHRAAVLGTGTLLVAGHRPLLLTAAHVLEGGVTLGNIMVPRANGHALLSLAGGRVAVSPSADIAVIDLCRVGGVDAILQGRKPASVPHAHWSRRRRNRAAGGPHRFLLSGYPAALSRFDRGWLGARRFTVLTRRREEALRTSRHADCLFEYGRVASRADGVAIHTPELQGMSGAGIWIFDHDAHEEACLCLEAVQSSFMHGRFVRGWDIGAAFELIRH